MQIYEVKNDTAEILYVPQKNSLFLSDFLFIEDKNSTIVSQVTNISTTDNENINLASVKFHLSVDKNNVLTRYKGQTPSKNSPVGFLDAKDIIELFKPKCDGIEWGDYIRNSDIKVITDLKFLSAGCAIICDRAEQKQMAVKTITDALKDNKVRFLLFDFDGRYKGIEADNTAIFGKNFRLPLDSIALDYIFENDLNDCPVEAKAYIQSIILSVQKYVDSSEDGFIPFDTFVNIIMSESKNINNASLMVFGNKLMKYRQKQIFADKKEQFAAIDSVNGSLKLDVSQVDEKFYPLILKSVVNVIKKKVYILADITEENSSASILKQIYEKPNLRLLPIINYDNPFLNKIKSVCGNFVLFAPSEKNLSDDKFGFFLDKLGNDELILYGENTLFIPLPVSLTKAFAELQKDNNSNSFDDISNSDLDNLDMVNIAAVREMMIREQENTVQQEETEEVAVQTDLQQQTENTADEQIINQTEESAEDFEKKKLTDTPVQQIENAEPAQAEVKDFYSEEEVKKSEQNLRNNPPAANNYRQEQQIEIKASNTTSASTANSTTQREMPNPDELQVYEPKEPSVQQNITFQEGDRVSHAQYGTGTIEKVINYGKKLLCSIQFDNVGRRLLDPNITTLEKI
ncbi:MAG: hypothetical protein K6C94_04440 [Candidatus Gastranaerophilales bacterium]|nr:hypothetical protein [Candidatus Gastranaerophilales bacterium]